MPGSGSFFVPAFPFAVDTRDTARVHVYPLGARAVPAPSLSNGPKPAGCRVAARQ